MDTRTHYDVLNLKSNCTHKQIKDAFHRLARKWHPDKHDFAEELKATEEFQRINTAYTILSDPQLRKEYDERERYPSSFNCPTKTNNASPDEAQKEDPNKKKEKHKKELQKLLDDLDFEIARLEQLNIGPEKKPYRDRFAKSLRKLWLDVKLNLEYQKIHNFREDEVVLNSPVAELARDTIQTLSQLSYDAEDKEQDTSIMINYLKQQENVCADEHPLRDFSVTILSFGISALGFILGAPLGVVAGAFFLIGTGGFILLFPFFAWGPLPGLIALGSLGVLSAVIGGGALACSFYEFAEDKLDLPNRPMSDLLQFKSPHRIAKKAAKTGLLFFGAEEKIKEQSGEAFVNKPGFSSI